MSNTTVAGVFTLADFRLKYNLSQGDLERKTGLSKPMISRVESSQRQPSQAFIRDMRDKLDFMTPLDYCRLLLAYGYRPEGDLETQVEALAIHNGVDRELAKTMAEEFSDLP